MNDKNENALPSANGLISPALVNMALKGFEVPCLQMMQSSAVRNAAQELMRRKAAGKVTTAERLCQIVDKHLAGNAEVSEVNRARGDVLPAHISNYINHKQIITEAVPAELLAEADALSVIDLPEGAFGNAPQLMVTNWLAKRLRAVDQYANTVEVATPNFAKALRARIDKIESDYPDRAGLLQAYSVLDQVATESPAMDVDEDDEEADRPR